MKKHEEWWWPDDERTHFLLDQERVKYNIANLEYALSFVTQFDLAVDVGANVGIYANYLSPLFKRVICYEPCAVNFECLVENTKHLENVTLVNKAVGDKSGRVSMAPGASCVGTYVVDGDDVDMIMLDTLGDFLKLDVEGYEGLVVKSHMKLIEKEKPVMMIEEKKHLKRYNGGSPEDYLAAFTRSSSGVPDFVYT